MVSTFVTQSRIASLTASLSVAVPDVTDRTSAPRARIRRTFGRLAADVLLAHVDDAREAEQGAGRGGGDAVLAGAGLGDDPGLAQAPGEQRLAEGVVDLVGAGVGEVLALEVEPDAGIRQAAGSRRPRRARAAASEHSPASRSAR